MTNLMSWGIEVNKDKNALRMFGYVYGHQNLYDGMFISTSKVRTVTVSDDLELITIHTLNTKYVLKLVDIDLLGEWEECVISTEMPRELSNLYEMCYLLKIGQDPSTMIKRIADIYQFDVACISSIANQVILVREQAVLEFKKTREKIIKTLDFGELCLIIKDESYGYFDCCIMKDHDGEITELNKATYHIGMFVDSVIVKGNLRYFIRNSNRIEFYGPIGMNFSDSENHEKQQHLYKKGFYLYNSGKNAIDYNFSSEQLKQVKTIKSKELVKVFFEEKKDLKIERLSDDEIDTLLSGK